MSPLLLFAPGAGAPSTSAWMVGWAARLAEHGAVEAFDYPYQRAGKKLPDRLERLIEAHREALGEARARHPERPVALVGKSMGGRVGCHVSLVELGVVAVVCFGYPLVSQSGALRDEVLRELRVPTLFVQGDRDPLCPLDALEVARAAMKAPSRLHVVAGGDHSLLVPRAEARRLGQPERDASVSAAVGGFLAEVASGMLAPVTESSAP